jgi:secretion/DNA translocation related TadE-like protein
MAGTTTAVGIVAGAALLTVGLAAAGAGAVAGQRLAAAADAAALAAADAASGAVPGVPCARAAEVAEAGGARLADCVLDDLIATVTVETEVLRWHTSATSRAGPPPSPG